MKVYQVVEHARIMLENHCYVKGGLSFMLVNNVRGLCGRGFVDNDFIFNVMGERWKRWLIMTV